MKVEEITARLNDNRNGPKEKGNLLMSGSGGILTAMSLTSTWEWNLVHKCALDRCVSGSCMLTRGKAGKCVVVTHMLVGRQMR